MARNGSTRAWRDKRARILRADDTCWLCGKPGADSVDHVVPVARGGTDESSNLKPAHLTCNRTKSDKDFTVTAIIRTSIDW